MRTILILALMCGVVRAEDKVRAAAEALTMRAGLLERIDDCCSLVIRMHTEYMDAIEDRAHPKQKLDELLDRLAAIRKNQPIFENGMHSHRPLKLSRELAAEHKAIVDRIVEITDYYGWESERVEYHRGNFMGAMKTFDTANFKADGLSDPAVKDKVAQVLKIKANPESRPLAGHPAAATQPDPDPAAASAKPPIQAASPSITVILKDGSTIEASSVMQTDDSYIIKTSTGMKTLTRDDVKEIKKP